MARSPAAPRASNPGACRPRTRRPRTRRSLARRPPVVRFPRPAPRAVPARAGPPGGDVGGAGVLAWAEVHDGFGAEEGAAPHAVGAADLVGGECGGVGECGVVTLCRPHGGLHVRYASSS
ncbi:putative VCBS protein [Streptomyces sp. Tu6071]|nr:putative VCBS protein [Streptomyces sp. Tu6071]